MCERIQFRKLLYGYALTLIRFRIEWPKLITDYAMTLRTPQEAVQRLIAAGRTQAAIADRAGVKQPTISRILSGEHKDPKSSVLIKLNEFADEVDAQTTQAAPASSSAQPQ